MKVRKRDRSSTSGDSGKTGSNKDNSNRSGNRGRNRSSRGNRRKRGRKQGGRPDGAGFWGESSKLPPVETDVRITDHPGAVPRSLGQPPLPGHEVIAEHYFDVVYERAVTTAGALAAAGGLIDPETLVDDSRD